MFTDNMANLVIWKLVINWSRWIFLRRGYQGNKKGGIKRWVEFPEIFFGENPKNIGYYRFVVQVVRKLFLFKFINVFHWTFSHFTHFCSTLPGKFWENHKRPLLLPSLKHSNSSGTHKDIVRYLTNHAYEGIAACSSLW